MSGISRRRTGSSSPGSAGSDRSWGASCACAASASPLWKPSAEQVDFVRRFGNKIYYGDASRVELLRAANADKAVLFVLAIEDVERSLATARAVRKHFPHLTIFARARNRQHAYALMDLGITHIVRDTFHSSLELAQGIMTELGLGEFDSRHTVETFRDRDTERLLRQRGIAHDTDRMAEEAKHWTRELEEMFAEDERTSAGEGRQGIRRRDAGLPPRSG